MSNLDQLEQHLGYTFKDRGLLQLALTHPSVTHESPGVIFHNQRLEFLGDSVLGLVLTNELFKRFPDLGEGPLTKARAHLVNRRSLASHARDLGIGRFLIISHGEEISGGRSRPSSLADAFEAILGAVFIDGGFQAAQEVIRLCFQQTLGELHEIPNLENPKGELQEYLQARSPEAPRYELSSVSGPDHDRIFECAVYHAGTELGRGTGKSKKTAESQAACEALKKLNIQADE